MPPARPPEPPPEEGRVGGRDLTDWPTPLGRGFVRVATPVASAAARLLHWSTANAVLFLTLLLGPLLVLTASWGVGEVYESLSERNGLAALDQPVLDAVVAHRTPALTVTAQILAVVGGTVGWAIVTIVLAVVATVIMRRRSPVVLYAAATLGSVVLTVAGKDLVGRARPPVAVALPPIATSPSFPSGHTLNTTVVMGVTAYLFALHRRSLRAALGGAVIGVVVSIAMGLSRVYLAAHWLTDVVAGWLVALAWLAVVVTLHRLVLTVGRTPAGSTEWAPPSAGGHAGPDG